MISYLLNALIYVIHIYSILCFVRIILTWVPQLNYSSWGRILSAICDPYLNFFSRFPLRVGMIDFTAMLAIGFLYIVESVLKNLVVSGNLSFSQILMTLISIAYSIANALLVTVMLIFFVRYFVSIFYKQSNNYYSMWQRFDDAIRAYVFKLCRFVTGGRTISYKNALLVDGLTTLFAIVVLRFLLAAVLLLIGRIPF